MVSGGKGRRSRNLEAPALDRGEGINYSVITDLIYTRATMPHTTSNSPVGLNAIFGDMHVSFSTTPAAFAPELWDKGEHHANAENPGDNRSKFLRIVSLLRP